ncbi:hypothetical protein [Pelagibacterium limicola]|uniref:hypothetical protein n=1 Tax=Pelagibacterium limicola TaxID=2791022 RepID=UPI0018B015D7|nr:hypothetical protein [Pelagibacterium limicola]
MRCLPLFVLTLSTLAIPALGQDSEAPTSAPMIGVSLTDRIWVRSDDTSGMPGSMQIFLSDGTLLSDSCWETYRLSSWVMTSDTTLVWNEDGMDIPAEIVELSEAELVLSLDLVNETITQRFEPAPVPYVCPDMPR